MNNDYDTTKTAGIIIIGNEILSGRVQDSNSFFLSSELRNLGVYVMRISVIPDEIQIIGSVTAEFSKKYDFVFTSGGLGPTHDDVTIAGIAKGFDTRLTKHPDLERIFRARYGNAYNEAVMKMAEVPEGAEIIGLEDIGFPIISFKNIFIFPGISEYLKNKFSFIKERFRSSAFHLRRFFLNANESDVAGVLKMVDSENKKVSFGSYPVLGNPEYKIIITAESKKEDSLDKAVNELVKRLSKDILVRVE